MKGLQLEDYRKALKSDNLLLEVINLSISNTVLKSVAQGYVKNE